MKEILEDKARAETNAEGVQRANHSRNLVNAVVLLAILFEPASRPSLKWLRRRTQARGIPSYRVGRLIFYNPEEVRETLEKKNKIKAV